MTAIPAPGVRPLENGWLDDTPIGDSVLRRFVFNQADLNELVARAGGGRAERTADVSMADAGGAEAFLNSSVLLRPLAGLDDPTLGVVEEFRRRRAAASTLLSVWPTPDLAPRGWELVGHPMLVVRSPGPVPDHASPGVRVEHAGDADTLGVAERIVVEGFPFDEADDASPPLFPTAALDGGLTVRVAYVDDEPAAMGNGFVAHGVVNLCLAATLPAARRRGAWRALVWARVADAADLPAVAFTSDDSRPGFERLGFLPVTRLWLWVRHN